MIFSNFWDSYFSKLWRVGEFSLRFTAAISAVDQRSLCLQRKRLILHCTKIGDAGCIRLHVCSTPSTSPSWTLDQPGTVSGQGAAYASGPRLRDRRDDEQRGFPYDAKYNVADIGVVNMGEIGAVRKRSRYETGPHDSSPCVARVKSALRAGYWPTCLTEGHMVVNDHTRSAENWKCVCGTCFVYIYIYILGCM